MPFIEEIAEKARSKSKTILLPEGQDPRVLTAARKLAERETANVVILASSEELKNNAEISLDCDRIEVIDFLNSDYTEELAKAFQEKRSHKGITLDDAFTTMKDRLYFGNMMLATGKADGLVAGSIASTGDMLRAAFQCIGTCDGITTGSSCFVMELKEPAPAGDEVLLYADCGVNPAPNPEQLSDIALATSKTYTALTGATPRVAFLSFSTKGSAQHELVERTQKAVAITREKTENSDLDIILDGELQGDAALVPEVAEKKCPESPIQGKANILIFPDLQAGNIAYKLTQRLARSAAYGPILQGLAKPVNDLSRGCSAEDIVGVAAITACQS